MFWTFFFFLIFIFTLFYFTILYWFCQTLTWIRHGCTWVPNPELPSHLPSHIISLDHPRAPAPSILHPALNINWRFISYMIVYMFQCHSPKSSHPLPRARYIFTIFTIILFIFFLGWCCCVVVSSSFFFFKLFKIGKSSISPLILFL